MTNTPDFTKTAVNVSFISILANILLSLLKLVAGIFGKSSAMISDAVHSMSDVFSSIIVIIGVKISGKKSDKNHPYGHERLECVSAILLSVTLLITAVFLLHTVIEKITSKNAVYEVPETIALIAAIVSIVVKEAMFQWTKYYAKKIDSSALLADAWHHRSDALSSIGALIGIIGVKMGFFFMDAVATVVICLFIIKASYDIFSDAIKKMVDHSISEEKQHEIIMLAKLIPDVLDVKEIRTREFGNKVYVDLTIFLDGNKSLSDADFVSKTVHDTIEENFPKIKHITVITRPYPDESEGKH